MVTVVSDMFQMKLLLVTIGLINLQLRHAASVTLVKAADHFGDHAFPLSLCLPECFWFIFHLGLYTPDCVG